MTVNPELVSIIVLNFNGEKIIRKCLDHLLAQTYPDFEIIVVDNNSSDGSLAILEEYLATGRVSVIRGKKNLGVPGGRNLGLLYATGSIIAFIDNDGYAHRTWLQEAVRTLKTDERNGAVASVVFFSRRKIILNGAGGTLNLQGYGGDICFKTPYEFAEIPHEVLYGMGCGLVIRRTVLDEVGSFDPLLFNYYDDAELGIRIRKSGFRVVVSRNAWIDHDFGSSDGILKNKVYLCERNRIRTVLKYFPASRMALWFLREGHLLRYFRRPSLRGIPGKAWAWNILHLGSALMCRLRFAFKRNSFLHLLHPSWGAFPPPSPNNHTCRPDLMRARARLTIDGNGDCQQLNFGWYHVEREGTISFRWTDAHASAFVNFTAPVQSVSLTLRAAQADQRGKIMLRRPGEIEPTLEIRIDSLSLSWHRQEYPCAAETGIFELLVEVDRLFQDSSGRMLGFAFHAIEFA